MKVLRRNNHYEYTLLREKWGVFLFGLSITLACLAMGLIFALYVAPTSKQIAFKYLGWGFVAVGLLALSTLYGTYNTIKKNNGLPIAIFSKDQLICSPMISNQSTLYHWAQIEKIIVTDLLITNGSDGVSRETNQCLIFFNRQAITSGLIENSKSFRSISRDGSVYTALPFPKSLAKEQFAAELRPYLNTETSIELCEQITL